MNRLTTDARTLWGEPVLLWAVIQSGTSTLFGFHDLGWLGIHTHAALLLLLGIENGLAAIHIALVTHRPLLGPIMEAFKLFAAFSAVYGLHVTPHELALALVFIQAAAALVHQSQTSPKARPAPTPVPPLVPASGGNVSTDYLVTAVYDGSTVALYVNGQQVGGASDTVPPSETPPTPTPAPAPEPAPAQPAVPPPPPPAAT